VWLWVGLVAVSALWATLFHTEVVSLLAAGAIVGLALFGLALAARRTSQAPPWQVGTDVWLALPVLAVHLVVSYLAIPIATAIVPLVGDQAGALVATATTELPAWLVALGSAMLVAPMEEEFWRGTVQPRIGLRADHLDVATDRPQGRVSWRAILLTTAVFALFHVPTLNIPLIGASLLGGVAWGWLHARTGGMVAPVLAHGGWTATMALFPPT
jgi:membrane protease YdiL (CAAX protease family)